MTKNVNRVLASGTLTSWVTRRPRETQSPSEGANVTSTTVMSEPAKEPAPQSVELSEEHTSTTTELGNISSQAKEPHKKPLELSPEESHQKTPKVLPSDSRKPQEKPSTEEQPTQPKRRRLLNKRRFIDEDADDLAVPSKSVKQEASPHKTKLNQLPVSENEQNKDSALLDANRCVKMDTSEPTEKAQTTKSRAPRGRKKNPVPSNSIEIDALSLSQPCETETSQDRKSLDGLRVVLTGVFDSCSREEMVDHVKRNGGMVTSAVSGATDILVIGAMLEDQRPVEQGRKFLKMLELQKAKSRKSPQILKEKDFLDTYCAIFETENSPLESNQPNEKVSKTSFSLSMDADTIGSQSVAASQDPENFSVTENSRDPNDVTPFTNILWAEKYRPSSLKDFIGNNDIVKKLTNWLNDWNQFSESQTESRTILSSTRQKSNVSNKVRLHLYPFVFQNFSSAVLLSGPPGIGKTSLIRVLAKDMNYSLIEFNASDDRGKSIVDVISDMTSTGNTLNQFTPSCTRKTILLMDEVDGLSAGDRGGAQALTKLIEKTRCPIVCICNDRYNAKIKTLASRCYDLVFHKPQKNVVAKRLVQIVQRENLHCEPNAVELLCERVGNDLRQMLNTLQFMSQTTNRITYDHMKRELERGIKDRQVMDSVFDVTKRLLSRTESNKMSISEKMYGYFTDYDIIPLYMQENYVQAYLNSVEKLYRESPRRKSH